LQAQQLNLQLSYPLLLAIALRQQSARQRRQLLTVVGQLDDVSLLRGHICSK
jgi:hypothetical protein